MYILYKFIVLLIFILVELNLISLMFMYIYKLHF
jgi:hypothetical protein